MGILGAVVLFCYLDSTNYLLLPVLRFKCYLPELHTTTLLLTSPPDWVQAVLTSDFVLLPCCNQLLTITDVRFRCYLPELRTTTVLLTLPSDWFKCYLLRVLTPFSNSKPICMSAFLSFLAAHPSPPEPALNSEHCSSILCLLYEQARVLYMLLEAPISQCLAVDLVTNL